MVHIRGLSSEEAGRVSSFDHVIALNSCTNLHLLHLEAPVIFAKCKCNGRNVRALKRPKSSPIFITPTNQSAFLPQSSQGFTYCYLAGLSHDFVMFHDVWRPTSSTMIVTPNSQIPPPQISFLLQFGTFNVWCQKSYKGPWAQM